MHTSVTESGITVDDSLNFEKVWTMFQETRQMMQESARELDRGLQETRQLMRESAQETEQRMKETDRKISKLGSRIGQLIEHLAASNILEKFRALGYEFTRLSRNHLIKDECKQRLAELDLLLENGEYAAVVEVKSMVSRADVVEHQERMEILRAYANERGDTRKYIAAMAGALFEETARNYALSSGLYVIEQTGDTVQIQAPPTLNIW